MTIRNRLHIQESKTTLIDKTGIRQIIPHAGAMCLLDAVRSWDATTIVCTSETHRSPANPLRRDGQLAALHAFEYGAQAIAIHGGLLSRAAGLQQNAPAYLAALREAHLYVQRLDDIEQPLEVTARRLVGMAGNCIYQVYINARTDKLAEARITIISHASA